jgi:crotonobetainyl-CoA:carnitine CoA-transferase CaiB-like acyl-CoA transferase
VKGIGHPIKFGASSRPTPTAAPELGEHTVGVLESFGFSPEEIDSLIDQGVVHQAPPRDEAA